MCINTRVTWVSPSFMTSGTDRMMRATRAKREMRMIRSMRRKEELMT